MAKLILRWALKEYLAHDRLEALVDEVTDAYSKRYPEDNKFTASATLLRLINRSLGIKQDTLR